MRKPNTIEIEEDLVRWIQKIRKLGIALNSTHIILKAIELFKDFEDKNYNALLSWYYSFLKRNNYSIRHITHSGQKLKNDSKE